MSYLLNFYIFSNDIFFFFSSRRRHTICSRDWSSDVCSSDLSSTDATITNISIKEKQDYLTPIYAEDRWGNSHKVLRRNLDNPTFNT